MVYLLAHQQRIRTVESVLKNDNSLGTQTVSPVLSFYHILSFFFLFNFFFLNFYTSLTG